MQLYRQIDTFGSLKNALGLRVRKTNLITKSVNGIGKVFVGDGGQYARADKIDVRILVVRKFGRQGVQTQKRGHYANGILATQFARDAQHFLFSFKIKSVAGFDFNRRHALGH